MSRVLISLGKSSKCQCAVSIGGEMTRLPAALAACLSWSTRSDHAPLPDLAGWPWSRSTWPCRPSSRLNRALLFCSLVIPCAPFARRSAIRLSRFTHVLSPAHLGRPLAPNFSLAIPIGWCDRSKGKIYLCLFPYLQGSVLPIPIGTFCSSSRSAIDVSCQ